MLTAMRGRFGWLLKLSALTAVLVLHGIASAEIGYRRITPLDQLVDPVRFPPRIGMASTIWDTTAVDTTGEEIPADSTSAIPDSSMSRIPADTSAVTSSDSSLTESPDSSRLAYPDTSGQPPSGTVDSLRAAPKPTGTEPPPLIGITDEVDDESSRAKRGKEDSPAESDTTAPPPWHPTNIGAVGMPVELKSTIDTTTGYVDFNSKLQGGSLPLVGSLPIETFLDRQVAIADRDNRRSTVISKLPTGEKRQGGGIEISIPIIKSKRLQSWFGGSNVGLTVTGSIQIDGSLTTEKKNELQRDNSNPTNWAFKINQKQQFNIKGKVGEKISVEIDQDSEKLFEFENNLRVHYKGEEDEIIQSIEAGNVSLSLGGTKLATASSQHKGLFGFKTESRFGDLKVTTIASLDKGEKNTKKISGGAKSEAPTPISPKNFANGRYYFLDHDYRENYRHFQEGMDHLITPLAPEISKLDVYRSVRTGESDNAIQGYAFSNPRETFPTGQIPSDRNHVPGNFIHLEPGTDYTEDTKLGWIRLKRQQDNQSILAVAYRNANGDFGDLDPTDNTTADNPFILKLIQPTSPQPTDSATWKLMWRNVYDISSGGLDAENFSLKIVTVTGQTDQGVDSGEDTTGFVVTYLSIFGLDQFGLGGGGPDGKVDSKFIRFEHGELIFPDLQPFAPEGWFLGADTTGKVPIKLLQKDWVPGLYDRPYNDLSSVTTHFSIQVKSSEASASFDLGPAVLDGSEEVILDGRRLSRGSDYTIDYMLGNLTITNKSALAPGANLEIRYETGQIFQLDTQTMLGIRAEYELWDNSYVGGTLLHLNQKTVEQRVRVGGEPKQNTVWDVNAVMKFEPEFLTRAVDWLPLIETDAPSSITFAAEVAQVIPNPNALNSPSTGDGNGVAYIDDFESVKRSTPLGISRRQWTPASFPLPDVRGSDKWLKQRGRMIWYNPDQIPVKEIWPERDVQAQDSRVQVFRIEYQPWWTEWGVRNPPTGIDPTKSWAGIMRYLGPGYADQSQSKYLEIWLNRGDIGEGMLYFDLGKISEDVIPDGVLNNEDKPREGLPTGDGSVTRAEDTGLDGVPGVDPTDSTFVNTLFEKLPSYDDWKSDQGRDEWALINGTESNGSQTPTDEGGRFPDTEDLSGDGFLDAANDFYRYRIDLGEGDASRYIVGGQNNKNGWRLYRIPLTDTLIVNRPNFTQIEYVRIWLSGIRRKGKLTIAQMEIVGNEWRENRVSNGRGGSRDPVSVAVINTHDNPEYNLDLPPGVAGEIDPVSGLREKEQSLVLRVNQLGTGETGSATKIIDQNPKMNLMEYKQLKMFVHGGGTSGRLVDRMGNPLDLQMFVRFGSDPPTARVPRYYEYSQRIADGWAASNQIVIDLERLASLKFLREQDSSRDYDILPDGDVIRVVGSPSLRDIGFIEIGLKNFGQEITPQDGAEIWVDEMRVSDISKNAGWAAAGSASIKLADLWDLSADLTQSQADFHNLNERVPRDPSDRLSGRFKSGFELGKLLDPTLGINIPLDFSFAQDVSIPKYKPNSDVKLTSISGENPRLWDRFTGDLLSAELFRTSPQQEGPMDSLITTDKNYTITSGFTKTKRSENPFVRYTIDNFRVNGSYQEVWGRDYNYLNEYKRTSSGNAGYVLSVEEPVELRWLGWAANIPVLNKLSESTFTPHPSSLNLSGNGTETFNRTRRRTGLASGDTSFFIDRSYSTAWRPFKILNFDFSQKFGSSRVVDDTLRSLIAAKLSTLDSTVYWQDTEAGRRFDTTAWRTAKADNIDRIKGQIFWKGFGYYFVDDDLQQTVSAGFSPTFVTWLGTETSYRTGYKWSWGKNLGPADRSIGTNSTFNATLSFRLTQFTSGWREQKGADPEGGTLGTDKGSFNDGFPSGGGKGFIGGGSKGKPGSGKPGSGMPEMDMAAGVPGESEFTPDAPPEGTGVPPEFEGDPTLDAANPVMEGDSLLMEGVQAPDSLSGDTLKSMPRFQPPNLLVLGKQILSRVKDIQWNYSLRGDAANSAVVEGQAKWAYQLGFTREPGLATVPGYITSDRFTRTESHRISTGLDITEKLVVNNIEMNYVQTENFSTLESGSSQRPVFQYFGSDGVTIKSIPAANWGIRWSGWESLPYLRDWATSVALDQSFTGSATEQWRRARPDSAKEVGNIDYEKNFSPLLGITFAWKGGVSTTVRYNWNRTVQDSRTALNAKTRNTTSSVAINGSYQSRTGFRVPIPVWPFNNRRFNNSTTFSLAFTSTGTRRESAARGAGFSTSSWNKSWSLTPNIEYSFSSAVRGTFRYAYSVQKSNLNATKSQEFGFTVNISIRG
jgi:hypothetical protein